MASPPPAFSSYLLRKSESGLIKKSWDKLFFVLDENGLAWFANKDHSSNRQKAKGFVPMHQLLGAEAAPSKGPARLVIHVRSPRGGGNSRIVLNADSPAQMQSWIGSVDRHLHAQSDGLYSGVVATPAPLPTGRSGSSSSRKASITAFVIRRKSSLSALAANLGRRRKSAEPPAAESGGAGSSADGGDNDAAAARRAAAAAAVAQLKALGGSSLDDFGAGNKELSGEEVRVSVEGEAAGDGKEEVLAGESYIGEQVERRVLSIPGNADCADCVTSDKRAHSNTPTWGSTNLGTVFCIRCSGVHRSMGAHVSKVLSLNIDAWSGEQLMHMRTLGNAAVNAQLEASMPAGVKPDGATCTPASLKAFIRAKYELGSFREGGDGKLPQVSEAAMAGEAAAQGQAKAMAEFCGLLIIRLIRATNLPAMDMLGNTDAFVEFSLGERKCTSKTVKKSLNPSWNQTLMVNVRNLRESLILKIFDSTTFGTDHFIGQCLIPLADLTHDGMPMGFDLTLERAEKGGLGGKKDGTRLAKKGDRASTVAIELTYNPLDR